MSLTQTAQIHKAPTEQALAIEAVELTKTYRSRGGTVDALKGVSFSVPKGSVFGLLGPNGAGKSTLTKILTTLSRADSGRAAIAGVDVQRHPDRVRRIIGYVPQKPSFDPMATGLENLTLQGRIFGLRDREIRRRSDELLERFDLSEAAGRRTDKWSGGMQRKLDVALALIHRPQVLFLDEPTTGLDPEARAKMWAEISRLAASEGLTVLLTTHYLEEADQLADELVIIDRGTVVASGHPADLKNELGGDAVHMELARVDQVETARRAVSAVAGVGKATVDGTTLRAEVKNGPGALPVILAALNAEAVDIASITVARPSLDEVYLRHTGRAFRVAHEDGSHGEGNHAV